MGKTDWRRMVLAFLHDPPDKALDIKTHKSRALAWLRRTGVDCSDSDLKAPQAEDVKAATEDRLPMPNPKHKGGWDEGLSVAFAEERDLEHRTLVRHALSGEVLQLEGADGWGADLSSCPSVAAFLEKVSKLASDEEKFFALWRFLPETLGEVDPFVEHLPAETRAPDHTIWNHLDLAAAFQAALADGRGGALLSFSIGPVQGFIKQAKSLRDLWAGSYVLSWLAFAAMTPVLDAYGPSALIFPGLRGNPLLDRWMKSRFTKRAPFDKLLASDGARKALLMGSLPNTSVALVPARDAEDMAGRMRTACREAWMALAQSVHDRLTKEWSQGGEWDTGWKEQIDGFWDLHTVAVPLRPEGVASLENMKKHFHAHLWSECWPAPAVHDLDEAIRSAGQGYTKKETAPGSWAMHNELLGRLMAATKMVRHVPPHTNIGGERPKCSLTGSLEQMGPLGSLESHRKFWEAVAAKGSFRGTHIRANERLSAVALVKRFAWAAYFADELGLEPADLRFSDTATVAARLWLKDVNICPERIRREHHDWSGQWVFQDPRSWDRSDREQDRDQPPPPEVRELLAQAFKKEGSDRPRPYYAAIAFDGDEMGKWLRGERAPLLREAYHPKLIKYFQGCGGKAPAALDARRPLSPANHAAMTAALGHFARELVPRVVEEHHGEPVYAGGDDALAILPTREALACARELREAYSGRGDKGEGIPAGWERSGTRLFALMGQKATASAGLVVAHYKADLRDVMQAAWEAEKAAKAAGRDALGIAILKRSGEKSTVVCPWALAPELEKLVRAFDKGASDRWAYQLRAEEDTMVALPADAMAAEIERVVSRGESGARETLGREIGVEASKAGEAIAGIFRSLLGEIERRKEDRPVARAFVDFVALVQAASFLARGREE